MLGKAAKLTAAMSLMATAAAAQEDNQQQGDYDLGTIVIEADIADTSSSYALPQMRSATKTDTPVLETPQALTVLTRKQFDDQNTQTVGQALRYTSGVLSEVDASTRYDSVFLRGFGGFGTSSQFVGYLDGLRLPRGQGFAQTAVDPFLLDRVDVLKGPSALLYGQSSPGGLVNMVSRSPDGSTGGEARLEYGSYDRVQAGFAQQGTLGDSGTLHYSIAAMGRGAGTRYVDVEEQRYAIAPELVWQPSDRTRLSLGGYWQKDPEGGYFNSFYPSDLAPAFDDELDRDLNLGDPDFDSFEREQWGVQAELEHGFTQALTLRSKLRYDRVDADMRGIQFAGAISDDGVLPRLAVKSHEEVRAVTWDTNLEYVLATGAVTHRLLAGADLQWNESDWQYDYTLAPSLDVTDPVYSGVSGPFYPLTDSLQTVRQQGVHLSDQLSFGGFRAMLGTRYDWIETESENRLADTTTKQDSETASWRAALLYRFDNGVAPYVSYATSFEPVIGVDASGDPFEPTRAEQWELGLKYQPEGMDALFTVAAFDIRQENVLTPGDVAGFYKQTGEIRSRGLEFEARGSLTPQVDLIASYTLLDTEVSKSSDASIEGNRPQAVPEHYGSIWGNYAFGGALDGLELGAGVRFVGSSYGDDANTLKADAYTLVDLAIRYDFGARNPSLSGLEATLNVRNLMDETYYSSCSYDIYCQYGEGRIITAGLRKTW